MLAFGAILELRWTLEPPRDPRDRFWSDFGLILNRCTKIRQKIDHRINSSTQQLKNKNVTKPSVFTINSCPRQCYVCRKINKNHTNMLQKISLKSMLSVASILQPTWPHFGTVLAPILAPSWLPMARKIDSKIHQKTDAMLQRFFVDFWSILDPNCTPTWVDLCWLWGPSWLQDGSKSQHKPTQQTFFAPSWDPIWCRSRPKVDKKSIQDGIGFLMNFGIDFLSHVEPTWTQNGSQNRPKMEPNRL